ncbi:trypsin-like serine peptidase [Aestuariivirga sp.]|uniref:trypsin-like serine peptidase n=1 Tax=Aestuariivirga sp. TaxID=2650926 RepID=UPI0039E4AD69
MPQVGSGDATKSADILTIGPGMSTMAPRAPAATKPVGPEMMIEGLAGIKHSRNGKTMEVPVPPKLQMMLKARGAVRPDNSSKGKLVQIKNTRVSPYASIGMIMTGCTGSVVMKRYVLTAPWCVYDTKAKKFLDNLDFVPALNGNDAPLGTIKWKNVWIPQAFQKSGDLNYAFALIELDQDIGDQTGWFGFGPVDGSENVKQLTLTSYPFADVPKNTLWEAKCNIDSNEANAYFYHCPGKGSTLATMLGGPFFAKGAKEGDAGQLLGIHITSQNDQQDSWWALKLNAANTATILAWANGGDTPPTTDDDGNNDDQTSDNGDNPQCTCDKGGGTDIGGNVDDND